MTHLPRLWSLFGNTKELTGYDKDLLSMMFLKYGPRLGLNQKQFLPILMFIHLYPTQCQVKIRACLHC